jgi:hypothetical protein
VNEKHYPVRQRLIAQDNTGTDHFAGIDLRDLTPDGRHRGADANVMIHREQPFPIVAKTRRHG